MRETAVATRAGLYRKGAENTGEGKGRKKYFRISRDKKAEGGDGQRGERSRGSKREEGINKVETETKDKGIPPKIWNNRDSKATEYEFPKNERKKYMKP